jgi:hypothetical protein
LAKGDGYPVPVASQLVVARDATVVGHYQSNRWRRNLGIAVMVTGAVIAGLMFAGAAAASVCPEDGECPGSSSTAIGLGAGFLAVGLVSGAGLLVTGRDSATVEQR